MVFQLQLTRQSDATPITRDYMAEAEQTLNRPARQPKPAPVAV